MSEIPLIIGVLQSKMPLGDNFPSTWQEQVQCVLGD